MKDKLIKLIDVKSIVTILITLVFCYLSVTGAITPEQFVTIFMMVVSFYFGVKSGQSKNATSEVEKTE